MKDSNKITNWQIYSACLKKQPFTFEGCNFNSFVACRWLSGNKNTLFLGNLINFYSDIPDEAQYLLIQNSTNLRYIKYPSNTTISQNDEKIDEISKKYNISLEKAREYIEILEKN